MAGLGQSVLNYGRNALYTAQGYGMSALGKARSHHRRGVGAIGAAGMATAYGAAGGAMYGGTIGRDSGQGMLGGAFTGALGGAALGAGARHYGRAAMRGGAFDGAARRYGTARAFGASKFSAGMSSLGGINFAAAGRDMFFQAVGDAKSSAAYIGRTGKRAANHFRAMGR